MKDYKEDLPFKVERRRNAQQDMGRLINLQYETLQEIKRTNALLLEILTPPLPKRFNLPHRPEFLEDKQDYSGGR
jgi:hypothetical protein